MLEAVNSTISNAPLIKAASPQVQKPAPSNFSRSDYINVTGANYNSRVVSLDEATRRAIIQIRDSNTGKSLKQFPTEGQIRAYINAQSVADKAKSSETGKPAPSPTEQKARIESTPDIRKPEALSGGVETSYTEVSKTV